MSISRKSSPGIGKLIVLYYKLQDLNKIGSCTLMTEKIAEPIEYIMQSEIGGILAKAFAELYRAKPNFPVTHLAQWLKEYSQSQYSQKERAQQVSKGVEQLKRLEEEGKKKQTRFQQTKVRQQSINSLREKQFHDTVTSTEHLEDLLYKWLPNYIEKRCNVAGAYVGQLTHPYKPLQPTNFQPGAELDTESPKIIEYIGTSDSQQKIMKMKVLSSEQGISFECFNQPEPEPEEAEPAEGQEPKPPKEPKKTYLFVPDVTKNEKIHYFKFPRLGSYACFPLKLKSVLIESAFDQGIIDYRQYVKQKQEAEKQFNDKLNQHKNQYEEAKKKFEQFEVPQEDPSPEQQAEKKSLGEQAQRLKQTLEQFEKNPPKTPEPKFNHLEKSYVLGCDTLGQDQAISSATLDEIDKKVSFFKQQFQSKERAMLLHDILVFIEEQPKLESLEHLYRDHEKNAQIQSQEQAKQKNIKDKELEFEIAATKAKKMDAVFEDANMQKSMQTYFKYNVPKFKEILQIALMLLGYDLKDINLSRKNTLDFRKVRSPQFIEQFLRRLSDFDLKPTGAEACPQQYKINKLLERLQKIDLEQVSKYNGFIWALANHIKSYCWALILCRDAKKEAYEISVKNSEERSVEIEKYNEQKLKAMNVAKAELGEQNQANFNEQEWSSTYVAENPQPQPIEVIKLQQYLNID